MPKSFAVFISGNGSNLQAIIDACEKGAITSKLAVVISNEPNAYGLERAQNHHIPHHVVSHKAYDSREAFEAKLLDIISPYQIDCIVLAGFMRQLTPYFLNGFGKDILNIHPSLLPKYPGLRTHERVLEAGEKMHGVTVHLVNDILDGGPILAQESFPILGHESISNLKEKVHAIEHQLYPKVIERHLVNEKLEAHE